MQTPLLDFYEKLDETSKISLRKISDQEVIVRYLVIFECVLFKCTLICIFK